MSFSETDRALLRKLYHYGYIGHRHTEERNALKGFPRDRGREVKKSLKNSLSSASSFSALLQEKSMSHSIQGG